jgi:hypothetical protein
MVMDIIKGIKDFHKKSEPVRVTLGAFMINPALGSATASYYAGEEQRNQAKKDQDNQFVRMRNAAQRAGFNPLTVLRNTGGQGFLGLPTLSKMAAFGNAIGGMFDYYKQQPIDKYNKQVRDLTLKSMNADIANTLANTRYTGILSKQALGSFGSVNSTETGKLLSDRINQTTESGVDLPNDPKVPQGYKVPDEVMEQFPLQVGPTSLSSAPMSAASVVEEQYGDAVSWFYGPVKFIADVYSTGVLSAHKQTGTGFNDPKRGQMVKRRLELIPPALTFNNVTPFRMASPFSPHR